MHTILSTVRTAIPFAAIILAVLLWFAYEIGYRRGRRVQSKADLARAWDAGRAWGRSEMHKRMRRFVSYLPPLQPDSAPTRRAVGPAEAEGTYAEYDAAVDFDAHDTDPGDAMPTVALPEVVEHRHRKMT